MKRMTQLEVAMELLLDGTGEKPYNKPMLESKQLTIWTDGGARNNPGPAGIGAVIVSGAHEMYDPETVIHTVSEYIGQTTNNQAEYGALVAALEWVTSYVAQQEEAAENVHLFIFTDSELMAYQIQGRYKVKNGDLQSLYGRAITLLQPFGGYKITPIRREKNQIADKLVNQAIDAAITESAH